MTRSTLTAIATAIAMTVVAVPSLAQSVCGKHADIVKRLSSGYGEHQNSTGIAANGNLVEVFASKNGNWTIIFTQPGGMTCLMAVGENWQTIKEPFKVSGLML